MIGSALVVLAASAYLLMRPAIWDESEENTANVIGHIRLQRNDTRLRPGNSMTWRATDRSKRSVRIGDAVFAGDNSYASITLSRGSEITIGENSMVVFREFQGQGLPNLENGNFRISVNGSVSVAVSGEIVNLEGQESEVQIVFGMDRKPQVKLLKGQVRFKKAEGNAFDLPKNQAISLLKSEIPAVPLPEPSSMSSDSSIPYYWRLNDFYTLNPGGKVSEHAPSQMVRTNSSLEWTSPQGGDSVVEISSDLEFTKPFRFTSSENRGANVPLFPGQNFWRVKPDKGTWSSPKPLQVLCQFRSDLVVEASTENDSLTLNRDVTMARIHLTASPSTVGFIMERSRIHDFSDQVRRTWIKSKDVRLALDQAGAHFVRFRAVEKNEELSEWSNTVELQVHTPSPVLTKYDAKPLPREEEKASRQIASNVEDDPIPNEPPVQSSRAQAIQEKRSAAPFRQNHWLWAGSGLQYSTFEESASNDLQVSYSSTTFLSLSLLGRYLFSDRWSLLGSMRSTPGYANSSESIQIQEGRYYWTTYSVEGLYSPANWNFNLLNRSLRIGLRFGLQHHSMPFVVKQSLTQVAIENSPLTMATAGAQFDLRLSDSMNLETFLRYQYPLASSEQALVSPGKTFDGSVGVMKMLSPVLAIGGFWYGQYQSFPYTRGEGSSTLSATQQIFFSSVEGRIGYIFP